MIAFIFPGQGAQLPGMLHALDALPGGADVLDEASHVLERDVRALDAAATLSSTHATQLALVIAGVASARALERGGVHAHVVAGHSIGAYAAAVAAGSLAFADALRVVDVRGRAMDAAYPHGYGMGAIGGLDERTVDALCRATTSPAQPVYAANVNARDQIAIAGHDTALDVVLRAAIVRGARSAQRIPVAVPSHCPLMDGVATILAAAFAPVDVRPARVPFAANRSARLVRDADRIRDDLVNGVAFPVRWAEATEALYEAGVRLFIEMQPGSTLTDLAARAFPAARAVALHTAGVASVLTLAQRM